MNKEQNKNYRKRLANEYAGRQLEALRVKHKLSREELAESLDVTWQYISKLIKGDGSFNALMIRQCCEMFQVSADYFIIPEIEENDLLRINSYLKRVDPNYLPYIEDMIVANINLYSKFVKEHSGVHE